MQLISLKSSIEENNSCRNDIMELRSAVRHLQVEHKAIIRALENLLRKKYDIKNPKRSR